VEYQLSTFGGLLVNVWGPTWDWIAHINYHRLLIKVVLNWRGFTVTPNYIVINFQLTFS
jgi:hypothetical protein